MNLILFTEQELAQPLPLSDPRSTHILQTLRRQPGEAFDAGLLNGPRGKASLMEKREDGLLLDFLPGEDPPSLYPISLLIGLSRPQTMRKILQEATSMGTGEIHVVATDKGEPSYAGSKLWSTGEYHRHLIAGAEQAFTTRVPPVHFHPNLAAALDLLLQRHEAVALDNYEATGPLRAYRPPNLPCLLAVGSERGWSPSERTLFRRHEVPLCQVGTNVLRTETAALCGLTLLLANLELL
jgi:16S rRNA (uracil1498-N3)-methyltransferase